MCSLISALVSIGDWGENSLVLDIFNLCITATGVRGAETVTGFMNGEEQRSSSANTAKDHDGDDKKDDSTNGDK